MHNNPLHVPVSASSSYSAITGALDLPRFSRSNSVRLPQTFYTPSNFSMPRPVIDRPIRFDWYGVSGQGVPMRNLIAGGPDLLRSLDGANDIVFPKDTKRILLAIKWPLKQGATPVELVRNIDILTDHGPITRAELGYKVAQEFNRFVETYQFLFDESGRWGMGINRIRLAHLTLISLWNVWDNVWQAEVAIEFM